MLEICQVAVRDFRAEVEGPADLVAEVHALRPSWLATPSSRITTRLRISSEPARSGYFRIEQDSKPLGPPRRYDQLLPYLDRAISAAAVAWLERRHLLIHAGAVAYQGRGCVLPAPSGSGKSTLVAGLVAAGFEYFSDEVAVLDRESGMLWPFPRPLAIKSGSRRVLARAYPALRSALPRRWIDGRALWQLPPPADARPTRPVPIGAVVLPRYLPRGRTLLTSVAASTVFPEVLLQASNPLEQNGRSFRALIRILGETPCYRLSMGRLSTAIRQIERMLGDTHHCRLRDNGTVEER